MNAVKKELGTLLRFSSVGILVTLVHFVIALTAIALFKLPAQVANLVAFLCALTLSYLGHHQLTFRSDKTFRATSLRFLIIAGAAYLCSAAVLLLLEQGTSFSSELQVILAACVIPAISYIAGRLWVF